MFITYNSRRETVVAQLAEWLLPMPDVYGMNPVICKVITYLLLTVEMMKIKKKRPGLADFA